MIIKSIKLNRILIITFFILIFLLITIILIRNRFFKYLPVYSSSIVWNDSKKVEKKYIKWVDFTPTYTVLDKTSKLDIESHNNNNQQIKYNWIELISYLACKYGGNFKKFNDKDLNKLIQKLDDGYSMEELSKDMKYFSYYFEAYNAILHEYIGEYKTNYIETNENQSSTNYGLKVYLPIAAKYNFNHYDDFGNSRSYGFKRVHLGNDLMGSIGTPIIAVESGTIEALGWNQYGGWRIGIRSFDKKRYYYYAHLRKDHPYVSTLKEGQTVNAGDVIGYLGMTGYSTKENVNNINVPHLHFGIQLIFDECQKDGTNQIWIDVYNIINFLKKNRSEVYKDSAQNEYVRKIK